MTMQIRRSAAVMLAGFLVLAAGIGYRQVFDAERLSARAGNPRIVELGARDNRGTILSADGAVLAASRVAANGRRERVYSTRSLAHAIGYLSITYGASGLEEALNGDLTGSRSGGTLEQAWHEITREPLTGNDLVLTIDTASSDGGGALASGRARWWRSTYAPARCWPRSAPSFDEHGREERAALIADPGAPLINRVTQASACGSVFKTGGAVAGPGERVPAGRRLPLPQRAGGARIHDRCRGVPQGVREYNFAHAYAWSINVNSRRLA
jgi:peptidoglycan glycosyltransferase